MSAVVFIEERVSFFLNIPTDVNLLLQAAVAASSVDQEKQKTCYYKRIHFIAIAYKPIFPCISFIFSKNVLSY
jgi:hypothetical protein